MIALHSYKKKFQPQINYLKKNCKYIPKTLGSKSLLILKWNIFYFKEGKKWKSILEARSALHEKSDSMMFSAKLCKRNTYQILKRRMAIVH